MRGGVVCYLERAGGGSLIRRVRLVAAGLSRTWTAPEGAAVSSVEGASEGAAVGAARSSAQWVAQSLESVGLKRLAAVCADADGSVCAWLSAPNPEPSVIEATVAQSGADTDGTGAGVGAARLLAMSAGSTPGATGDVSLQALATLERTEETPPLGVRLKNGLRRSGATTASGGKKSRYAVLAVPDAPLRVFMDELDRLGVEVEAVVSLWHAMAFGWDPDLRRASSDDRLVANDQRSSAVVLVEPAGRLVWAWTLGGEMVAGGTMRLATVARSSGSGAPAQPAPPAESALATTGGDGSARRVPPVNGEEEPSTMVEFSSAEAGRLVMDWLAWSAQLGQCPQRVVCLACPTLGSSDGGGPESLARLLAKVWPNATIDGAVHDDPVGATIARLAGLGNEDDVAVQTPADELPAAVRPRAALVGLSSRPGRADRALHRWIAAAMIALAAVIGAAAFQAHRSVSGIADQVTQMQDKRKQIVAELGTALGQPAFAQMLPAQQADAIQAAIKSQREQLARLRPPRPVIEETVRFLSALDGFEDVKLVSFEVSPAVAVAELTVPDADTGPEILQKLRKIPGQLPWEGSTPPGTRADGARPYKLTAIWPEGATRASAAKLAPAAAVPATPPGAPAPGQSTPENQPPATPSGTPDKQTS